MKKIKLCIIGTGNMGEAIISGVLKNKIFKKNQILAIDISKEKLTKIKRKYNIQTSQTYDQCKNADTIILAVKPQDLDTLLLDLKDWISQKQLIISIIAGKTIKTIEKKLNKNVPLARVMPNTPALINKGISGICFNKKITNAQKRKALKIIKCLGNVIQFNENKIDAVTAISGSGPAYVFYFIEALTNSAIKLGFDKKTSEKLVMETIKGSIELIEKTKQTPEELRAKVTSKGGTTEAAIKTFEKNKFKKTIYEGIKAALKRSKELN